VFKQNVNPERSGSRKARPPESKDLRLLFLCARVPMDALPVLATRSNLQIHDFERTPIQLTP